MTDRYPHAPECRSLRENLDCPTCAGGGRFGHGDGSSWAGPVVRYEKCPRCGGSGRSAEAGPFPCSCGAEREQSAFDAGQREAFHAALENIAAIGCSETPRNSSWTYARAIQDALDVVRMAAGVTKDGERRGWLEFKARELVRHLEQAFPVTPTTLGREAALVRALLALRSARAEAFEEAAKVADDYAHLVHGNVIARRIRALKDKPHA